MAGTEWIAPEEVGKGADAVDTIRRPPTPAFDDLIVWFGEVTLFVEDQQGVRIGKIEVAKCKTCSALIQKDRPSLSRHTQWHQR